MTIKTQLAALEKSLADSLPDFLVTHWLQGPVSYREYEGLSPSEARRRWASLTKLVSSKAFKASTATRRYSSQNNRVAAVHFSPKWVPFAEDSGGNLLVVDLGPGPRGKRGQVLQWEIRGGGAHVHSPSIEFMLRGRMPALASTSRPQVLLFPVSAISKVKVPEVVGAYTAWWSSDPEFFTPLLTKVKEKRMTHSEMRAVFHPMSAVKRELNERMKLEGGCAFHAGATREQVEQFAKKHGAKLLNAKKLKLKSLRLSD